MTDAPLSRADNTAVDEEKHILDAEVSFASAERLTFFSDAVVAIAITLLALELPVPSGTTNGEVWHSLVEHRWEYFAFLISFWVIGSQWLGHHKAYRFVARLGGRIILYNMVWLMLMVITPFATKTLTGPGDTGNSTPIRFTFYAGVQAVAGLMLFLIGREMRVHRLLRPNASPELQREVWRQGLTQVVMFVLSVPLFWLTHYAWLLWVVWPWVMRTVGMITGRYRKTAQPLT